MQVTQADPAFHPVTIVLETQDEYDMLMAVLHSVAENKINHIPNVMAAARQFKRRLEIDTSGD